MKKPRQTRMTIRMPYSDRSLIDRAVRVSGQSQQAWALTHLKEAADDFLTDPASRSLIHRKTLTIVAHNRFLIEQILIASGHRELITKAEAQTQRYLQKILGWDSV